MYEYLQYSYTQPAIAIEVGIGKAATKKHVLANTSTIMQYVAAELMSSRGLPSFGFPGTVL